LGQLKNFIQDMSKLETFG